MSDQGLPIPNYPGWSQSTITEVSEFVARGTAPVYVESSDVLAIGQRCVTDRGFDPSFARPHDQRRMRGVLAPRSGDVFVNSTGTGTIGRSCVYDSSGRFIVDGHITVVRPRQDSADGRWIEALIRSPWGQSFLEGQCYSGSTSQVELSSGRFSRTLIPLPSIQEQHRIADILGTAADAIRSTELLIAKLEQAKQGLLHDLVTRGIDRSGHLRDPERQADLFVHTPLGLLPKVWDVADIGTVANVFNGSTPSRLRRDFWDAGKVPWLASGKVNDYEVSTPSELVTGRAVRECALRVLPVGAVVVGMIGEGKTRGMAARLCISATINQNLAGIVPGKRISGKFLHLFLSYSYEALRRGGRGSNQDALNTQLVSSFQVAVPEIQEQRTIERLFSSFEDRVNDERRELEKFRSLKQGLMDDLLTGRARVGVSA